MPLVVYRLGKEAGYRDWKAVPTDEIILVYSGVFSFKYIYFMLHEWYVENKYCHPDEHEFREDLYSQRDSAAGKEIFIKWRLRKETGDYYIDGYEMDIAIHTLALSPTEVMVDGRKMKLDKGEVEFKIYPRYTFNPKLSKSWWWQNKRIKKFLDGKYFIEKNMYHLQRFKEDLERLQDMLKEHFEIESYVRQKEILEFYKSRMGQ